MWLDIDGAQHHASIEGQNITSDFRLRPMVPTIRDVHDVLPCLFVNEENVAFVACC